MKKTIVISLVLLTIFLFIGCKGSSLVTTTTTTSTTTTTAAGNFSITSSAFVNNARIPTRNECVNFDPPNSLDYSIPLSWTNIPAGTLSFVITMIDIDSTPDQFMHWLVINIPSTTTSLNEGASSHTDPAHTMPAGSTELVCDWGHEGYGGPNPPTGTHHYVTTIYALDVASISASVSNHSEILAAISGHVIASANITGLVSAP